MEFLTSTVVQRAPSANPGLLPFCKHADQASLPGIFCSREGKPVRSLAANPNKAGLSDLLLHRRPLLETVDLRLAGRDSPFVRLCDALDEQIDRFVEKLPVPSFIDPSQVLADNFAPVGEHPPTNCTTIDGELPRCLDGAYIRNGPNPHLMPRHGYHLLEGDGMVHALVISDGQATFCSRFVQTYKYMIEEQLGMNVFPRPFSDFYTRFGLAKVGVFLARILTGQLNLSNGSGPANTSLCFFNNKLMALHETDLPYVMRLTAGGDIETVMRFDFEGKLSSCMTAHPKIDPETGDMFAFWYSVKPPFLNYFYVDSSGEKHPDVPISSLHQPSMVHDFAITEKHAIFLDAQILVKPVNMLSGNGPPVVYDAQKQPRVGVIPRYATDGSSIMWLETPGFNFIHTINAWDNGDDEIVLVAANTQLMEHVVKSIDLVRSTVEIVRISIKEGNCKVTSRKRLSKKNLELGVINPNFLGRRNRYAYMATGDQLPKASGIVKLDFEKAANGGDDCCVVGSRDFGERCFAGEPFFIARDDGSGESEEDDGYLVTYMHDEGSNESRFLVMDAKSPMLDIVASVKLPQRVPYGFHGLFIKAAHFR